MKKRRFFIFLFITAGLFAVSAIVMLLWNAILPDLVHVEPINYWQAMGLFALSRLLFGGFRFGGGRHRGGPPFGNPGFKEKFMNMSEEERAAFRASWRDKCGK